MLEYMMYHSFHQLLTVAVWLTQQMAVLLTVVEQHLDRQPTTVVIQVTTWWEVVFAYVKLHLTTYVDRQVHFQTTFL